MWIASHTVLQVVIFIAVAINCIVLALQVNVNYMYQIPFLVIMTFSTCKCALKLPEIFFGNLDVLYVYSESNMRDFVHVYLHVLTFTCTVHKFNVWIFKLICCMCKYQ